MIRVFPRRTKWTPTDKLAFVGDPTLFRPDPQPVKVSCTFTWDIQEAERLHLAWSNYYDDVELGGPAFGDPGAEFVPGRFIKKGVIITSRGCPYNCSFCLVPKREGKIRKLPIVEGNIIQDNNLLACSNNHIDRVFQMLEKQKAIEFKGGIDCKLLKDWHIERMRNLRIKEIWLALDHKNSMPIFQRACDKLKRAGFNRKKIRCYILAGYNEPIQKSEERLRFAYECGTLPFIQVYQSVSNKKRMAGEKSREDNLFVRKWSRPATYNKSTITNP